MRSIHALADISSSHGAGGSDQVVQGAHEAAGRSRPRQGARRHHNGGTSRFSTYNQTVFDSISSLFQLEKRQARLEYAQQRQTRGHNVSSTRNMPLPPIAADHNPSFEQHPAEQEQHSNAESQLHTSDDMHDEESPQKPPPDFETDLLPNGGADDGHEAHVPAMQSTPRHSIADVSTDVSVDPANISLDQVPDRCQKVSFLC